MVHLTVTFNDTIDEVAPTSATGSVQVSATGKTVDVTFNAAEAGGLQFVVKINHGTSIYDLAVTNYDYTVS